MCAHDTEDEPWGLECVKSSLCRELNLQILASFSKSQDFKPFLILFHEFGLTDTAAIIKQKLHDLAFPPVLREGLKWLGPGLQVTDFSVLRILR